MRSLSVIACIGTAIMLGGTSRATTRTGSAITIAAGGGALATLVHSKRLQAAEEQLKEEHLLELKALEAHVQTTYVQREASLQTFLEMSMTEAEMLKGKIAKMHESLTGDQLEKVSLLSELEALEDEYQHALCDLQESAIAEASSQAHIARLETTLTQKTEMAAQMLTELESEATSTFNQFTEKVAAQGELIEKLYQKIESLKATNATLTRKQIDKQIGTIGAGSPHHDMQKQFV